MDLLTLDIGILIGLGIGVIINYISWRRLRSEIKALRTELDRSQFGLMISTRHQD